MDEHTLCARVCVWEGGGGEINSEKLVRHVRDREISETRGQVEQFQSWNSK